MARPLRYTGETPAKTDSAPREARLEIRLTREQKSLVARAAAAGGVSVAEFVRQAVQEAAVETVTEHEVLKLCVQDQEAFAAALLAPRDPSVRLKATYRQYLDRVPA